MDVVSMNILSVGTSVIDLFLSIDENYYRKSKNSVVFNLGDKVSMSRGDMTVGGNAANVAVSFNRLGFNSSLYTYFGTDILSSQIQKVLKNENIKIITGIPKTDTTPLHLIFNFKEDRIIFSEYPKERYQFSWNEEVAPEYVYLTSIGEYWEDAYQQALDFIQTHQIPFAFSPGTRQLDDKNPLLHQAIKSCAILLVNKEEAMKILNIDENQKIEIKTVFQKLHQLGPKLISITDGGNGAYASNRKEVLKIKPFNDQKPVIQKVGAGDAYSSAFVSALLNGKTLAEAMQWGAINSHSVMGHLGAQAGLLSVLDIERVKAVNPSFQADKI